MERRRPGSRRGVRSRHDDLRQELGQTLTLFGMGVAVIVVGLLMGLHL
jgi:hypothetical protein